MRFLEDRNVRGRILKTSGLLVWSALLALAFATPPSVLAQAKPGLTLTTTAFEDGGIIPTKYTAAASGPPVSPKLIWTNVPDKVVSFALIERDPDTSVDNTTIEILHWIIFNIPASSRELPEKVPAVGQLPDGAVQGLNYTKKVGYIGMGAPAPGPFHHYTFELFALDMKLSLSSTATETDVLRAMDGHILAKGVVVGRFHR